MVSHEAKGKASNNSNIFHLGAVIVSTWTLHGFWLLTLHRCLNVFSVIPLHSTPTAYASVVLNPSLLG